MNGKSIRAVLGLIVVGMYFGGLIALFLQNAMLGFGLWVFSTVFGLGLLYWNHITDHRAEDDAQAGADPSADGGEGPAGPPEAGQ